MNNGNKYINIITLHAETFIQETNYGYQFDDEGMIVDVSDTIFKRWYLPYNEENLINAINEHNKIFGYTKNTEKQYKGEFDYDETI